MTTGLSWQVEGVRPQARETAQEAARRSGMSVGEWLDSVISDSARSDADGRLDAVGRRLDQLSRLNTSQAYLRPDLRAEEPPRELTDVISKLDRRLDQLIA